MNKILVKESTEEKNKQSQPIKATKNRNKLAEMNYSEKNNYKKLTFKNIKITPKKDDILISKSKIIFHINKIFFNIAQYSTKEKDYLISKYQLIDILKQGKIISENIISINQADIILTKLYPYKRNFNFSEFMNFLTELCQYLYQDKFLVNPKTCMDNFLSCLYNNYKDIIILKNSNNFLESYEDNSCTLKCIEMIISAKLETPIFKLILTLYDNLVKIYKVYFPNEIINYKSINEEKITAESSQNLFKFWKDFEIFPTVMSKINLNMYFNLLMKYLKEKNYINKVIISFGENEKYIDIGICFRFSSFILCLYHFCMFYHFKRFKFQTIGSSIDTNTIYFDENLIDVDKITFFFKKLENSNGIKKYLLKRGRTNENRFNFILKKKDIKIANKEMKIWLNDNKYTENDFDTNKKSIELNNKYKVEKKSIDSSPYTSRQLTERNMEKEKNDDFDEDNDSYLLTNESLINKNIFTNCNFNKYFLNINKKDNYLISISDLDEILSVSPNVKEEIINKIENLSEIFLRYSKINNKLEYNRMSFSSFIKFLTEADLLITVPEKKKFIYRRISNDIMSKTLTISSIKTFENALNFSVSNNNITLSQEEIDYKKNVSKIVNPSKKITNKKRLTLSEVSLIFSSVTGSYNFPSYLSKIKKQFNKIDELYDRNNTDYIKKTDSFEPRKDAHLEKDVPKKMNLALFIKSFELIASKLYPKILLDDAVLMFLDLKIQPFIYEIKKNSDKKKEIKKFLSKMEKPEIKEILKKLGEIIHPFYIKFADNNEQMQFYQFFDFYINLELFPEMISLFQLKNIFSILCENNISLSNKETIQVEKNIKDKIDFSTLIKSLGISSMLFNFKNIMSDIDRLLYIYYFILKSNYMKNINISKNIVKKIQKNLKHKQGNIIKRNGSIDDLNNRKIKIQYDNRTKEYIYVSKIRKTYNFYDVYK